MPARHSLLTKRPGGPKNDPTVEGDSNQSDRRCPVKVGLHLSESKGYAGHVPLQATPIPRKLPRGFSFDNTTRVAKLKIVNTCSVFSGAPTFLGITRSPP